MMLSNRLKSNLGEEDEELHVHIAGDDESNVEKAAKMVLELLQPKSEEMLNKHKENQLRELVRQAMTIRLCIQKD